MVDHRVVGLVFSVRIAFRKSRRNVVNWPLRYNGVIEMGTKEIEDDYWKWKYNLLVDVLRERYSAAVVMDILESVREKEEEKLWEEQRGD